MRPKSEGGEGERVGLDRRRRALPLGEAVAKLTIDDDGILSPFTLLLFLLFHLDLEACLGAWDGRAVTVQDGRLLGLPATAAGCFTEYAGASKGVGVEFAIRLFELCWELKLAGTENASASPAGR